MAIYKPSDAKIYRNCTRLLEEVIDLTHLYPKEYKCIIGDKMQNCCLNLLQALAVFYRAGDCMKCIEQLTIFQYNFDIFRTLVRLSWDKRWIRGEGRFAALLELMDTIESKASDLRSYLQKTMNKDTSVTLPESQSYD